MRNPYNYRNKVQLPVGMKKGQLQVGFYAKRSHDIIDYEECRLQDPVCDKIREIFRNFIKTNRIHVYDETTHKGLIRHLMIRKGFRTGEIMVVVVINGKDLPLKRKFVSELVRQVDGIKSIMLNINTQKTNVILGEKNVKIYGSDTITDYRQL